MKFAPLICFCLVLLPIGAGVYLALEQPDRSSKVAEASVQTDLPTWRPKLVVDRQEHDFGVLPIAAAGECRFNIQNVGAATAPLQLWSTSSSIGRLKVELSETSLEPGESGFALVRWHAADELELFDAKALVRTNDPLQPMLEFRVHGRVESDVACKPTELSELEIRPHKQTTVETLV